MAAYKGFGQQLHDARVSGGLTYGTVSRKLRIRVDILQAIEEEDFATMPPRSYARGMVHAYASLLGLNADRVTQDYLEAEAEREGRRAPRKRSRPASVPASLSNDVSASDLERLYQEDSHDAARERLRQRRERRNAHENAAASNERENPRRSREGRSSSSAGRNAAPRSGKGQRGSVPHSGSSAYRSEGVSSNRARPGVLGVAGNVFAQAADTVAGTVGGAFSTHKNIDINHSIYADNKKRGAFSKGRGHQAGTHMPKMHQSVMSASSYGIEERKLKTGRLPLVAIGIILVVLLVVGLGNIFTKPASSAPSETSAAPGSSSVAISGLTDPGSAGTVEKDTAVVPIAPTAAVFTYEIADGEDCYLEIYLDGAETPSVASTFTGPKKGTYDVTGTLSFVTSRPSVVTLKVDGSTVEPKDDNGDGVYVYNIDFREILDAWKKENGQAE